MKIVVFPHQKMVVGGTVVTAIELSAALRDKYDHDVVLFAQPGPMMKMAEEKGLRLISAPEAQGTLSRAMMHALREMVQNERPDLVHAWDSWCVVEAYYAVHLFERVPLLATDMSSDRFLRVLPKTPLTTFGTPERVDRAKAAGRRRAELLVPPVDVHANAPGIVDPEPFRRQYNMEADEITLVTVSRLEAVLKGESLRRTIDAVRVLGREFPLRLVIVGDGDARNELEWLGAKANTELGRPAVIFTGELLDPRAAYAAADIVVGMGGSALRGMAFGKPVIIVGQQNFSSSLTPETAKWFYYHGIGGIGDGNPSNARLIEHIRALAESADKLTELGAFSRQFVLNQFDLETVCGQLDKFCRDVVAERRRFLAAAADGLRTAAFLSFGKFVPDTVRRLVRGVLRRFGIHLPSRKARGHFYQIWRQQAARVLGGLFQTRHNGVHD